MKSSFLFDCDGAGAGFFGANLSSSVRCSLSYLDGGSCAAAVEAGGTLAHHHGAGRSKAPRLLTELGDTGIDVVKGLMRAFDPKGIFNPGNLIPDAPSPYVDDAHPKQVPAT